jgi:pimeloyl-ACP methyl ester carboxylesterase
MQSFSSDGVRIAFIDVPASKGPGDPVLLIHGFASTHAVNWVNTLWTKTLAGAGYRVIALDNRGHGQSDKLYDPAAYHSSIMAEDARRLFDHLGLERADVMGYSMGARITAFLALQHPGRVRSIMLGGIGIKLVEGVGLPTSIADAMEAPSVDAVTDPTARGFRPWSRSGRRTRSPARRTTWRRSCRTRAPSTSRAATTTSPSATAPTRKACSPSWRSGLDAGACLPFGASGSRLAAQLW